jgi:hypothetical protein
MGKILMDKSTGFVSADELVQLAEPPKDLSVGDYSPNTTGIMCASAVTASISAITASITAASGAMGDNCPTTACTSRC